jgi:acyl transferase domain-containing protein
MSHSAEQSQSLSPIKRALMALEDMQAKLDAIEYAKREPIAIIGIGCRFPGGAAGPVAFWQLLRNGVDAITEVPKHRWDIESYYDPNPDAPGKMYIREGGFLGPVDDFNPQFFGISAREAKSLDPQQRLLLEVAWEAIENANKDPQQLFNSSTGVFIGISSNDYQRMIWETGDPTQVDAFCATGNALSIAAGRLSYTLGLKGPSLAVDTACASSLVALHLACQSLRSSECDMALVGGVNLLLAPESTVAFARTRVLDPDGRCKTFDATSNGYVRGEGCGVLLLKRLRDAQADSDNILAVIRGSAVNHNGRSSSLVAPNGPSQQALIRKALSNAGVDPLHVNYVEVQGTGTAVGQPLEVEALMAVLGKNRPKDEPLILGSVKTNIGHTEAASGTASLIKVILSLQHGEIPPHLHFHQPNPHINWEQLPIKVPTECTPWTRGEKQRIASVHGFGFNGTNAHIILEEAPPRESRESKGRGGAGGEEVFSSPAAPAAPALERVLHLLALSAKSSESLMQLTQKYEKHLAANPDLSLANLCFTANTGRAKFQHRLCITASSLNELQDKLTAFNTPKEVPGLLNGKAATDPIVAFLFPGESGEYTQIGHQLYKTQPTFRNALEQCEEILRPQLNKPLLEILYPDISVPPRSSTDNISVHPRLSAVQNINQTTHTQLALFTLEYALFQLWKSWGVEPAIVIGSGIGEYVAGIAAGIFNLEDGLKLVIQLGRSTQDKELEQIAKEITYTQPQIPIVSTITGTIATAEIATPAYWSRQPQDPVKFVASIETLHQQGCDTFIEVSPKPVLIEKGRQSLPQAEGVWLATLNPEREDWQQLLESLATLYVHGVKIDWFGFDRDYSRSYVQLPTYPWQKERYWIETSENNAHKFQHAQTNHHQTQILNLLHQGDTDKLVHQLQAAGKLSTQELQSLPKILELLINQHQQQLQEKSIVDVQTSDTKVLEQPPSARLNTEPLTAEDIKAWLVRQIAKELGVKPEEIDTRAAFDSYGLDSMLAISIASAGQNFLGFEVSPLLLLHYPTIDSLSEHLAKEFEASGSEIFEI